MLHKLRYFSVSALFLGNGSKIKSSVPNWKKSHPQKKRESKWRWTLWNMMLASSMILSNTFLIMSVMIGAQSELNCWNFNSCSLLQHLSSRAYTCSHIEWWGFLSKTTQMFIFQGCYKFLKIIHYVVISYWNGNRPWHPSRSCFPNAFGGTVTLHSGPHW